MDKTSTGLTENVAGLLCYLAGWVTGLVFLLIEKENKVVRFHAKQSIIVFGAMNVVGIILGLIPIIGGLIAGVICLLGVVLWIVLMIKAYQGTKFKVPIAGKMAEEWVN